MKNLFILIIIIGIGYFAYQAFNKSVTNTENQEIENSIQHDGLNDLRKDIPKSQQGAITDLNNKIKDTLSNTRNTVEKVENRYIEL
jgi:predicted negative regulator of RcsB-dependent stress response